MVPICSLDLYVTYRLFQVLNKITRKTSVICTHIHNNDTSSQAVLHSCYRTS